MIAQHGYTFLTSRTRAWVGETSCQILEQCALFVIKVPETLLLHHPRGCNSWLSCDAQTAMTNGKLGIGSRIVSVKIEGQPWMPDSFSSAEAAANIA